ncbi:unnamed protein product, partial [Didymodactylos carnosus]
EYQPFVADHQQEKLCKPIRHDITEKISNNYQPSKSPIFCNQIKRKYRDSNFCFVCKKRQIKRNSILCVNQNTITKLQYGYSRRYSTKDSNGEQISFFHKRMHRSCYSKLLKLANYQPRKILTTTTTTLNCKTKDVHDNDFCVSQAKFLHSSVIRHDPSETHSLPTSTLSRLVTLDHDYCKPPLMAVISRPLKIPTSTVVLNKIQLTENDIKHLQEFSISYQQQQQQQHETLPKTNIDVQPWSSSGRKTLAVEVDDTTTSFVAEKSAFDELHRWLSVTLKTQLVLRMIDVQTKYRKLLVAKGKSATEAILRTASIRRRLENLSPSKFYFYKHCPKQGTYVALNNIEQFVKAKVKQVEDIRDNGVVMAIKQRQEETSRIKAITDECELILRTVELLRKSIVSGYDYFKKLKTSRDQLAYVTSDSYWKSCPTFLKNFIGLITLNDRDFNEVKRSYTHYDSMYDGSWFSKSKKWLKISSISFDIMNCKNDSFLSPKHYLLGNELLKHARSSDLITVMNRFGHVCSYEGVCRLHDEQARKESTLYQLPKTVHPNCFGVKVADNFDLNKETVHGENSIHIMNQIIIQNPENIDISLEDTNQQIIVLDDEEEQDQNDSGFVDDIQSFSCVTQINPQFRPICTSTPRKAVIDRRSFDQSNTYKYKAFVDNSLTLKLFAYGLSKHLCNDVLKSNTRLPLLAGYFATHLEHDTTKPLHIISFCTPIDLDPSSQQAADTCLKSTKTQFLDTNFQKEAVIVVDEKIYRNCIKSKYNNLNEFQALTIYAGDFHLMKCYMVVIWDVLEGSGLETIISYIYKGASLRSIFNVHHFNKSLRCCKLIYTALSMQRFETFLSSTSDITDQIKQIISGYPHHYAKDEIKQRWFKTLINCLESLEFQQKFDAWKIENKNKNIKFQLWSFILDDLISPLISLYMALRTSNFDARNASLSKMASLFFATNHRNYARLCGQHLYDLQTCSKYLFDKLSKCFAVRRTNKPFTAIAMDQTIECTINKLGKGHGGISGRFSSQLIDTWTRSFAYRSLLTNVTQTLCEYETNLNCVDAHLECTPSRYDLDDKDLQLILEKLKHEDLFTSTDADVTKLMTKQSKVIHADIVKDLCSSVERGTQALETFIDERIIRKLVPMQQRLKAIHRLRLKDSDRYEPLSGKISKPRINLVKEKPLKLVDNDIKRYLILGEHRQLDLSQLFSHEFTHQPLALCPSSLPVDKHSSTFFGIKQSNNTTKTLQQIYLFFQDKFLQAFSTTPSSTATILIIDGKQLLTLNRPLLRSGTIQVYSKQLFDQVLLKQFEIFERIDIIFDSLLDKDDGHIIHDFNPIDILPNGKLFDNLLEINKANLTSCLIKCWLEQTSKIPTGKTLILGGPGNKTYLLTCDNITVTDSLACNHLNLSTRILFHVKSIQQSSTILIRSTDPDVFILSIAYANQFLPTQLFLDYSVQQQPSVRDREKDQVDQLKIINCTQISTLIKEQHLIDPLNFLLLHALSGCTSVGCSSIRNIRKYLIFDTYFKQPTKYDFTQGEIVYEQLLLSCYRPLNTPITLDELRSQMAMTALKRNSKNIALCLPPTSDAFQLHCKRVQRQLMIWIQSLESNIVYPPYVNNGYELNGEIIWKSKSTMPKLDVTQLIPIPCQGKNCQDGTCKKCTSGFNSQLFPLMTTKTILKKCPSVNIDFFIHQ